ncbi:class II fructose-bisphosphate aldolase, partial [Streptomyces sparsus]
AATAVARAARVPLALHLDHVTGLDLLHAAHPEGFSSVMFDGSSLPYDDNVKATAEAVRWGRRRGIWVESELGRVGGKDGGAPLAAHTPGARTEPDEAARFVEATDVDALAAAVGSTHAMRERTAVLDTGLIRRLHGAVPVPLVLHGSSGVPDDGIRAAVAAGISKVNIGTALNAACTAAVRAHLAEHPEAVDPRTYLAHGRQAMADTVEHFLRLTAGPR